MRLSEINDFINSQLEWLEIDDQTYLNKYSYGQNWDDIAIEELKRFPKGTGFSGQNSSRILGANSFDDNTIKRNSRETSKAFQSHLHYDPLMMSQNEAPRKHPWVK